MRLIDILDGYAAQGLRTLMYAMKEIEHDDAEIEAEMRSSRFELSRYTEPDKADYKVESHYTLLGVTGVEDLLQDNVKSCIRDFMRADIKVWMLTGDKGATAK